MKTLAEHIGKELFTLKDCLDRLHWSYISDGDMYNDIKCDCGSEVKISGWIGAEQVYCPSCGKGMQDMTGMLPCSQSTTVMIDIKELGLDASKNWLPENIWGLK